MSASESSGGSQSRPVSDPLETAPAQTLKQSETGELEGGSATSDRKYSNARMMALRGDTMLQTVCYWSECLAKVVLYVLSVMLNKKERQLFNLVHSNARPMQYTLLPLT